MPDDSKVVPTYRKMGRTRYGIPREDIELAMKNTDSNREASRYMGINFHTYKRYASMYKDENGVSLYEKHKNSAGKGRKKKRSWKASVKGKSLIEVMETEGTKYFMKIKDLKPNIIAEGIMKEECGRCNFREKRVLDDKVPLILHFCDGDKQNWKLQNLEFLCYNCYFITIGDVFTKKQVEAAEDWKVTNKNRIDLQFPDFIEDQIESTLHVSNIDITEEAIEEAIEDDDSFGEDLISYIKPLK